MKTLETWRIKHIVIVQNGDNFCCHSFPECWEAYTIKLIDFFLIALIGKMKEKKQENFIFLLEIEISLTKSYIFLL